jgi:hypothetical protein
MASTLGLATARFAWAQAWLMQKEKSYAHQGKGRGYFQKYSADISRYALLPKT